MYKNEKIFKYHIYCAAALRIKQKKINMKILIWSILLLGSVSSFGQTEREEFLDRWDHSEEYLLKFVNLMPDSLYSFRPDTSMFSFEEQLHHIIEHLAWITNDYLGRGDVPYVRQEFESLPPKERLAALRSVFQDVREAVLALDETDLQVRYEFRPAGKALRTLDLLYLLLDHTTHHRGQLVVYLRLNGLKPPKYVGW